MSNQTGKPLLSPEQYTVGWISVLECELAAAIAALDVRHQRPRIPLDKNSFYAVGSINRHNVVIACSGEAGTTPANNCAAHMRRSFPNIRVGLLAGIGGGVPSEKHDIRLGDVVVSQPCDGHGGVACYDQGKLEESGFRPTGHLNRPPEVLLTAITHMNAERKLGDTQFDLLLAEMKVTPQFASKEDLSDDLYDANNMENKVYRQPRSRTTPEIHYGLIASDSWVIETSGSKRADLIKQVNGDVLCFEMEAAGLMNHFPCLVVRGISDYCDSHKNDGWHGYAAFTAAGFCKWLLNFITPEDLKTTDIAAVPANEPGKYETALTCPRENARLLVKSSKLLFVCVFSGT